jgi:hypothetical protein
MNFSKLMTALSAIAGSVAAMGATGGLALPGYVVAIATVVSTIAAKVSQSPVKPKA